MRLRLLAVAVLLIIVVCQVAAAPGGQQQYIVKIRHLVTQPNANPVPSVQDVVRAGGGHIDYEWRERLVVTVPEAVFQALAQHPAVEFLQKVVSGVPDPVTSGASSVAPVVTTKALRPSALRPVAASTPPWTSGTYSYDGVGNITSIGANTYSYDPFSRLTSSATNGIPETYTYDRYGNMTQKVTGSGSTALTVSLPVDASNHLSGHCYDIAGNLTDDRDADPVHCPSASVTYSYDALNRMTMKWRRDTNTREYYVYNANDERIAVIPCSSTPCTEQITFSFRDESGKVLRQFEVPYQQFDSPWTWVEDYVYRDGVLLAAERMPSQGGRRYFSVDHLGTPRLITDSNGHRIGEHDYFPFGVEATPLRQDTVPPNSFNREEPMKFTGHERDFTVGTSFENTNYVDYMHARSTVPQWGRFLSVDPSLNLKRAMTHPQAWNRYTAVESNPMNMTDPDGRNAQVTCRTTQDTQGHSTTNCTATVVAQIVVHNRSEGAAAQQFAYNARSYWNRQTVRGQNGENIKFNVSFNIVDPNQQVADRDTLTVVSGAGRSQVQMTLDFGANRTLTPDTGNIYTRDNTGNPSGMAGIAPHETGHLFGLRDLYPPAGVPAFVDAPQHSIMEMAQPHNNADYGWWVLSPYNGNTTVTYVP